MLPISSVPDVGFKNTSRITQSYRALSTGKKTGSMANVLLAQQLAGQAAISNVGATNGRLGMSRLGAAHDALNQAQGAMSRLSELSVRATDGGLSTEDRAALNTEATSIRNELADIVDFTKFNGQNILQGGSFETDVGGKVSIEDANGNKFMAPLAGLDLTTEAGADAAMAQVESAQQALTEEQVRVSAGKSELSRAVSSATYKSARLSESASGYGDVDVAAEVGKLTKSLVQHQVSNYVSSVHKRIGVETVNQLIQNR